MKIKIVGFKVGKSRPTANITVLVSLHVSGPLTWEAIEKKARLGLKVLKILDRSDFISIRRVEQ